MRSSQYLQIALFILELTRAMILKESYDLVDSCFGGVPSSLAFADCLRISTSLGDEINYIKHVGLPENRVD